MNDIIMTQFNGYWCMNDTWWDKFNQLLPILSKFTPQLTTLVAAWVAIENKK